PWRISSIPSSPLAPGGLFVAFPGARVDGHDYVDKAAQAGAVAALTTKEVGSPAVIVEKLPPREGDGRKRPFGVFAREPSRIRSALKSSAVS
ncbi:hypothetical protein K4G97_22805, partial [Mycobacterium tuberculosis]|nr:hypothetical protein [Mycobacterium tuberculosis]